MKTIVMCAVFFVSTAAASTDDSAIKQLVKGSGGGTASVEVPGVVAGQIMAGRDIFKRVEACRVVDAVSANLISFEGAFNILRPCMEALAPAGLSVSMEKGRFYSRPDVLGFENEIQIVVTGSAPTSRFIRELESALAARDHRLLSFRAKVVDRTTPFARRENEVVEITMGPVMAGKGIFERIDACHVVDVKFFRQPALEDAISMLKPCLEALSTGGVSITAEKGKFYSRPDVQGFTEGIQIVVTGSVDACRTVADLEAALAARYGGLLTYRAKVVNRTTPNVPREIDIFELE